MNETTNLEAAAIRCGCEAADVHLACSFPDCSCRVIPAVVRAAIAFALRVKEATHAE